MPLVLKHLIDRELELRKVKGIPKWKIRREIVHQLLQAGAILTPQGKRLLTSEQGKAGGVVLFLICPKCNKRKRKLFEPKLLCRKCSNIGYSRLGQDNASRALFYLKKAQEHPDRADYFLELAKPLIRRTKRAIRAWK